MDADARRAAALLLGEELATGRATRRDLAVAAIGRATRSRPVPARPVRLAQRLALRQLPLGERAARDARGARAAVLGTDAAGPPRVLLRVDEWPHWRAWEEDHRSPEAYRRFHAILAGAGVPYLLAVVPRVARRADRPDVDEVRAHTAAERALLEELRDEGVALGLHGLDHRTRDADPRRYSELGGLAPDALRARLDAGLAALHDELGVRPRTLVPPFNALDEACLPVLAERFDVVTGGPESARTLGLQPTPTVRGGVAFLPAYRPLYGTAAEVLGALQRLAAARVGTWVPVVLHWGWEQDRGWTDLERLAAWLGDSGLARPWTEFEDAVAATREVAA